MDTVENLSDLNKDIWVDHDALNNSNSPVRDGGFYDVLILGAGYGGLLFAARLIQAGISAENIRIVDNAGGFGGTWYWNRYPGLMCDVESYMYMPLLEETGYMPQHKYAYGPELLQYANRLASHFDLQDKALFRSRVTEMRWNDEAHYWTAHIYENRGPTQSGRSLTLKSRFVITTGGVLNVPHVPNIEGLRTTKIPLFHSARWRYDFTGGTPTEQKMEKLRDKRVGIIGTGPTAIQVVPELAKWSKHLLVFQRTPTSCDVRGQRKTDPDEWKQITAQKGWQRERIHNFNHFLRGEPLQVDLVRDGWCQMPSFSAVIGSACKGKISPEGVETHIAELNAIDFPRAQRLRERVDNVVRDKTTAEKLKSWYPTYCKRPTFHDEYLESFNRPNVELIETSGFGVESITEHGLIVNGIEHEVDLLILSTGFRSTPAEGVGTPSRSCNIEVFGRNGLNINDKWDEKGPVTLHGCCTHDFPNFFFGGLSQTGNACNVSYVLDNHARNVAYYIQSARKATKTDAFAIEPSRDAEEEWANESASMAAWFAALSPCTPGNYNNYAKSITDPTIQQKLARAAPWGLGSQDFYDRIEKWRQSEGL
ncbi:hypothetical protein COCMIDRAFT_23539 [Bipolaris oryzae ATCC 44560]|uniref:Uncharacterized protein n=1 Tax=Bipolaris oryzae ATCC 44560 TaxID=930090 RepID=W6ZFW4_COCMI|nr:uncharacterized protein COCMIDRAFT_23539 [Bipolaris oryzae ATCC 44560]EUC48768.1 hypothetical protein COCMIDRAFT_23539 [Bipolaris oryzae ATCC 44560]